MRILNIHVNIDLKFIAILLIFNCLFEGNRIFIYIKLP